MDGALSEEKGEEDNKGPIYALLRGVFTCLSVAMRYEPANAKYFQVDMNCGQNMIDTVKPLGRTNKVEHVEVKFKP